MAPSVKPPPGIEQGKPLPKVKVLLVHEDIARLRYYCDIFEGMGLQIVARDTYAGALACLNSETFGFVVVSQGSHAFEGGSIIQRAKEIDRHTPVLVVTPYHNMAVYLKAMQMDAVDYLEEPVKLAEMVRVVKAHLYSSNGATSSAAERRTSAFGE